MHSKNTGQRTKIFAIAMRATANILANAQRNTKSIINLYQDELFSSTITGLLLKTSQLFSGRVNATINNSSR
jgi:hypothetical protein